MFARALNWIAGLALAVGAFAAQDVQAQSYSIKPGDTLRIEVLEDSSLTRDALVLPDGTISFPLVGSVPARGRSLGQVGAAVRSGLAPNFANPPTVHVSIAALAAPRTAAAISRTLDIYALGEVQSPGRKEVSPGVTLLQFLAEAGGLAQFAADKRIELIRTNAKTGEVSTYLFNYRLPQGSATTISGSTELQVGDVIKVPQKRLFE